MSTESAVDFIIIIFIALPFMSEEAIVGARQQHPGRIANNVDVVA